MYGKIERNASREQAPIKENKKANRFSWLSGAE